MATPSMGLDKFRDLLRRAFPTLKLDDESVTELFEQLTRKRDKKEFEFPEPVIRQQKVDQYGTQAANRSASSGDSAQLTLGKSKRRF